MIEFIVYLLVLIGVSNLGYAEDCQYYAVLHNSWADTSKKDPKDVPTLMEFRTSDGELPCR